MSDGRRFNVQLSGTKKQPDIKPMSALKNGDRCPNCGYKCIITYGMAGGGMGPYALCDRCRAVVCKDQDPQARKG